MQPVLSTIKTFDKMLTAFRNLLIRSFIAGRALQIIRSTFFACNTQGNKHSCHTSASKLNVVTWKYHSYPKI